MNKVNKLKRELCNPEPVRRFVRLLTVPGIPLAAAAIIFFLGRMLAKNPLAMVAFMYVSTLIAALIVFFTVMSVRRMIRLGTLKKQGRMSWQYLVDNHLEQQAAEEFFGDKRVECTLLHKGQGLNAFHYRKNIVTPNFSFIMSDGVVLHHSEVASTYRQRISRLDSKGRTATSRVETFVLCMEDETAIPLMSYNCKTNINGAAKDDLLHVSWKNENRMKTVNSMIKEVNPACKTSLNLARATVIGN